VDFTLAYVVAEGRKLGIATPLCGRVLEMIHELENGKRQLGMQNYDELRAAQ
jgi:2-dehydropantoate 2-reductase